MKVNWYYIGDDSELKDDDGDGMIKLCDKHASQYKSDLVSLSRFIGDEDCVCEVAGCGENNRIESEIDICAICREDIADGETCYTNGDIVLCQSCASGIDDEEFLKFTEGTMSDFVFSAFVKNTENRK